MVLPEELDNPSLKELKVVNGNITKLTKRFFDNLVNIEVVDLTGNPLETIEDEAFHKLTKLTELRITNANLKYVPNDLLVAPNNLKRLTIFNKRAEFYLDLKFFQNIVKFNMQEVELIGVADRVMPINLFVNMVDLQILNLGRNSLILYLPSSWFDKKFNLQILNLEKNQFDFFERDSFQDLVSLKQLNLRDNLFTILRADVFKSMSVLVKLMHPTVLS